jgi:hypothetical protein
MSEGNLAVAIRWIWRKLWFFARLTVMWLR